MPVLDLNSVILSSIGLTFMLVLVLLVFGAYQQPVLIMRWVWGMLLVGVGLGIYFILAPFALHVRQELTVSIAFSAICLGLSVYVNGIRMLRGYRVYRHLSLLVITTLLAVNAILLNMHAPLRALLLSNMLVMTWVFAYGSRSLMGFGKDFVSHVFWLCCSLFSGITLMMMFLMFEVALIDAAILNTFQHWSGHAYMVVITMMVLMAVTCLLLLVMHVRAQAGLQAIATLDGLTGVLNRRGLQDAANRMQAVSQRIKLPMGMLIIDLDYFKKVNDVYGHLVGDAVLKVCAETIRSALRGGDVIGRYGGEEFCILLPNTGEHESAVLAERIRKTIETTPVNIAGIESLDDSTRAIKCTVSAGSVSSETVGYQIDSLFAAADHNLYQAKQAGRNRIASNEHRLLQPAEAKPAKRHASVIVSQ